MRAVVMRGAGNLVVDDVPDPVPGPGQLLVRTIACGICGSDLHFLKYAPEMLKLQEEMAPASGLGRIDLKQDIVMGHEFAAEVLELGKDTQAAVVSGDKVVPISARRTGSS